MKTGKSRRCLPNIEQLSREELLALARQLYVASDHAGLRLCIEAYEERVHDGAMSEFRWLMETSCF